LSRYRIQGWGSLLTLLMKREWEDYNLHNL